MTCQKCGMPCKGTICNTCSKPERQEMDRCGVTLRRPAAGPDVDKLLETAEEHATSKRARFFIRQARQLEMITGGDDQ